MASILNTMRSLALVVSIDSLIDTGFATALTGS
jgi:hypothetical protein